MEDKQETLKTASKVRYELKPNSFLDLFFIFIFPLQITVTRFYYGHEICNCSVEFIIIKIDN